MSKRSAEGNHSSADRDNDGSSGYGRETFSFGSRPTTEFGAGFNPKNIDQAKSATSDIMANRRIAPLRGRRNPVGNSGFRTGSPAPGVDSLGNIFGQSAQPAINGASTGTAFTFGQNQQSGTQSFPPSNAFGNNATSTNFQPSSTSFSFPAPTSGGFAFNAGGAVNNPFSAPAGPQQQSSQQGQGSMAGNFFGQNSAATPTFQFGAPSTNQSSNTPVFGNQQGQSQSAFAAIQAAPQTVSSNNHNNNNNNDMQISPPTSPARGTGQQQQPVFGSINSAAMSQTPAPNIFGQLKPAESKPDFSGLNASASTGTQNMFAQSALQASQTGHNLTASTTAPTPSPFNPFANLAPKPQSIAQSSSAPSSKPTDPTTTPSNPFANLGTPATTGSVAPSVNSLSNQPSTALSDNNNTSEVVSASTPPSNSNQPTAAPTPQQQSGFKSKGTGAAGSTPAQMISSSTTASSKQETPSGQPTADTLPVKEKSPNDLQDELELLNAGFRRAVISMDISLDYSDMMRAYLSRVGHLRLTYKNSSYYRPSKRKVDDTMSQGPTAKDRAAELFPEKVITPAAPAAASPGKSQTANLFSSILARPSTNPSPASTPSKPSATTSTAKTEATAPTNPFANVKSAGSSTPLVQPPTTTNHSSSPENSASNVFSAPKFPPTQVNGVKDGQDSLSKFTALGNAAKVSDAASTKPSPNPLGSSLANPFQQNGLNKSPLVPAPTFKPTGAGTAGSPVNFLAQFAQSAAKTEQAEKEKRKAEEFDSEEDDEEEWERKDAERQKEKKRKADEEACAAAAALPKFAAPPATNNFMAQFANNAAKTAQSEKQKRKAEEFDSEEDDEEEWERQDAARQEEKQRKLQEGTSKKVKFDGTGFSFSDSPPSKRAAGTASSDNNNKSSSLLSHSTNGGPDTSSNASGDADVESSGEDTEVNSHNTETATLPSSKHSTTVGKSLFDRITPAATDSSSNASNSTTTSETTKESLAKNAFGFPANSNSTQDAPSKNAFGFPTPSTPLKGFGSSTTSGPSLFGQSTTASPPGGDHTWKQNTPIKFGDATNTPSFNFTSATPTKSSNGNTSADANAASTFTTGVSKTPESRPFANLFGGTQQNSNAAPSLFSSSSTPTTNQFGSTPSLFSSMSKTTSTTPMGSPAKAPFTFGSSASGGGLFGSTQPKQSSLLSAVRAEDSVNTSRATSPAGTATDAEDSAAGEGGDNEGGEPQQEQTDLTGVGSDEEILFEQPEAKAIVNENKAWVNKGTGILRVLKNKKTGVPSVLLRMTPSGKVVFNSRLQKQLTCRDGGKARITIPIISSDGKLQQWVVNLGKGREGRVTEFVKQCDELKGQM